jgi:hypothetical protein
VPRADEPKRSIRFSAEDDAMLKAASEATGQSVSALVQECVRRSLPQVARDLKGEPGSYVWPRAVTPQVAVRRINSRIMEAGAVPGVKTARDLLLERQERLNDRRDTV